MSHAIRGGRRVRGERAWGPLGARRAVRFPIHFPSRVSSEHGAGRHPGERRRPGSGWTAGSRAARRAVPGVRDPEGRRESGNPDPAPGAPVSDPAQGPRDGRPLAQNWHGRAGRPGATPQLAGPPPRPPARTQGDSNQAAEAGFPRKRALPAAPCAPAAGRAARAAPAAPTPPRPCPPSQRRRWPRSGAVSGGAGGRYSGRPGRGRHSPQAAAAPSLRLRQARSAKAPAAPSWPGTPASSSLRPAALPAQRRTRGHGRTGARGWRAGVGPDRPCASPPPPPPPPPEFGALLQCLRG